MGGSFDRRLAQDKVEVNEGGGALPRNGRNDVSILFQWSSKLKKNSYILML